MGPPHPSRMKFPQISEVVQRAPGGVGKYCLQYFLTSTFFALMVR